jgi:transcriptional regulator GlxA family with amidase domain
MATQEQKTVAFVLYPGLTLLDMVGPLQVFASLRQFNDQYRPVVVAERLEPHAHRRPAHRHRRPHLRRRPAPGRWSWPRPGCWRAARPTTHWAYHRLLERLGATYLPERWVEDGKFITSAGVSAGIDMALALVARLTDEPMLGPTVQQQLAVLLSVNLAAGQPQGHDLLGAGLRLLVGLAGAP